MHWRRHRPADRELSDYSVVAAALQKRRAERKQRGLAVSDSADPDAVCEYQPKERLAERAEQTRTLVEDAVDIPRTWEPDSLRSVPADQAWMLHFLMWISVLIQCIPLYAIAELPNDPASASVCLALGAAVAIGLIVCARGYIPNKPGFASAAIAVAIFELLGIGFMAFYVCTR